MTHDPRFDGSQSCLDAPPEASQAFLEAAGADLGPALALCRRCAFTDPCRAYALTRDGYGVWGATNDEDRHLHRVREDQPAPTSITDDLDQFIPGLPPAPAQSRPEKGIMTTTPATGAHPIWTLDRVSPCLPSSPPSDTHAFVVAVTGCTRDNVELVPAEWLNHDEDYGFDYHVTWRPAPTSDVTDPGPLQALEDAAATAAVFGSCTHWRDHVVPLIDGRRARCLPVLGEGGEP